MRPSVTPMIVEAAAATKPMMSEGRAPMAQRAKRSRPRRGSTPSQCAELMPTVGSPLKSTSSVCTCTGRPWRR